MAQAARARHDADQDILIYHYCDANRNGQPFLGINFLGWDANEWPYVRWAGARSTPATR